MTGPVGGADPVVAGGEAHHSVAVGAGCRRLADAVHAKAAEGRFVLTMGGDHSIALGSVAGILQARPNARVLWVDAHADINTPAGSPSGNMHGEFKNCLGLVIIGPGCTGCTEQVFSFLLFIYAEGRSWVVHSVVKE